VRFPEKQEAKERLCFDDAGIQHAEWTNERNQASDGRVDVPVNKELVQVSF